MKTRSSLVLVAAMSMAAAAYAQKGTLQYGEPSVTQTPPPAPPKVWVDTNYQNPFSQPAAPAQRPAPVYVYDQKPLAGRQPLVTQEQAQTIINRFKEAYPKLGSPRLLIYVNRELVDEQSGIKLIKREEKIETSRGGTNTELSVRSTGENSYRADTAKAAPTLADRQTVRDVERLFGRPLRTAGATLVDQKVATQLIADRPVTEFIGSTDTPQARKDREALSKVADTVIEILISSKTMTVPTISDSQTITVPDIQATAINLKDSKVIAQVSS
ncbi:MAG TPA: hypothetical protein VK327_17510, partial [Candidatus Paceibacterota bacterium]|nr:hypothetical protein [Candidatus Paceibacterota bacterium]